MGVAARPARCDSAYPTAALRPRVRDHLDVEGSPLLVNSRAIADALEARWARSAPDRVAVALGMRYGTPSIPDALLALREAARPAS